MKILRELAEASGSTAKMEILKQLNELEQKVFEYAYDPDKVYGVRYTDEDIDLDRLGEPNENVFHVLDALVSRQVTGHAARQIVEDVEHAYGDLIKLICNKDLRCGVTATTINKVYPGLIPQFKLQLAKEVPVSKLQFPMLAQLKYDGVRIAILWDGIKAVFKTRNGKVIHLPNIGKTLAESLPKDRHFMIDTEVTIKQGKVEDRTKVSGMINSARAGNPIDETMLVFNVFDAMPLTEFNVGKCAAPYQSRLYLAEELVTAAPQYLSLAKSSIVNSAIEANKLFEHTLAGGYEGLILKPINHLYTFKRSKDWVKMKAIKTADLMCVAIEGGTGKYQNMIGALVCKGEVEGKEVTVKVGSGLTDLARSMAPGDYLFKTIEIKYNSIIMDSVSKQWSLFLPRYVCTRFDK